MAIVGYARVSAGDQDLTVQLEQLKEAGCDRIFSEKISGTTTNRAELKRALAYIRPGDTFVVTRIDRMARSTADFFRLMTTIQERDCAFRCLKQQIDTSSSTGRLTMTILAAIAEFETEVRKERQREGIIRAKARGVYDRKPVNERSQIYSACCRMLRAGKSYEEVEEVTGVNAATLRYRYPLYDKGLQPTAPSAAEAVEQQDTPETSAEKPGILEKLFGR